MNARPNFIPGLPVRNLGTDAEHRMLASVGNVHPSTARSNGLIEDADRSAESMKERLGGSFTTKLHYEIGLLQTIIRKLCDEADAAALPPTDMLEMTVTVEGDAFTVRYEVDDTGDIEIKQAYTSADMWGLHMDPATASNIEDEVTRRHLALMKEEAAEVQVSRGRAALEVRS